MTQTKKQAPYSTEFRERAIRMVREHRGEHASQWAAVVSIAAKIGCTAQTLQDWMNKADMDAGLKAGVPTEMADRIKALERENRELRQANEILKKASAYFAQAELDRPWRK
jgi:transposase-like protein